MRGSEVCKYTGAKIKYHMLSYLKGSALIFIAALESIMEFHILILVFTFKTISLEKNSQCSSWLFTWKGVKESERLVQGMLTFLHREKKLCTHSNIQSNIRKRYPTFSTLWVISCHLPSGYSLLMPKCLEHLFNLETKSDFCKFVITHSWATGLEWESKRLKIWDKP